MSSCAPPFWRRSSPQSCLIRVNYPSNAKSDSQRLSWSNTCFGLSPSTFAHQREFLSADTRGPISSHWSHLLKIIIVKISFAAQSLLGLLCISASFPVKFLLDSGICDSGLGRFCFPFCGGSIWINFSHPIKPSQIWRVLYKWQHRLMAVVEVGWRTTFWHSQPCDPWLEPWSILWTVAYWENVVPSPP